MNGGEGIVNPPGEDGDTLRGRLFRSTPVQRRKVKFGSWDEKGQETKHEG